ncbi:DUF4190 domain-containing protein [Alkalicoccus daliensis]|uniref:DUF4190 domain-containing protein n=1 Tax=Alkalicoccus daliensis TaxID=745820 RepID=A0A1H0DS48_9BACI|nr:DUF4190 domain-containing protein [Alkalicoccus daliensis]SDN72869.1 protein of unknown function [Alkalicoccus daliensis]
MTSGSFEGKGAPPGRNTKSLVSFILGITALLTALLIGIYSLVIAVPGLIVGILALKEINENPQPGKGLAWGGIICSIATAAIQVLLLLFIFFVIA